MHMPTCVFVKNVAKFQAAISLMALKDTENVINRKSLSQSFKKETELLLEMWLKNPKSILSLEIWSGALNKMPDRELGFRKVIKAAVL